MVNKETACPSATAVSVAIELAPGASPPHYASPGAAGADLRALLPAPVVLEPGSRLLIPTGIKLAVPEGYEVQIRPRSGLAANELITVLNTPGTIDSDYRGEIQIILINHGKKPFTIESGMRIAQMILAPVCRAHFEVCPKLSATHRGDNGFGHTGTH